MSTKNAAIKAFGKKYKEKTGNRFGSRREFVARPGKYEPVPNFSAPKFDVAAWKAGEQTYEDSPYQTGKPARSLLYDACSRVLCFVLL